jgi:hypothetical protein
VKFLGYTAYSHFLRNKVFDDAKNGGPARTFKIGGTRTLIGLACGLVVGTLASSVQFYDRDSATRIYLLGLLPIGIAEWWLLLWLFFRARLSGRNVTRGITLGIVVSYLLDAIGILAALVIPGGNWVC